MSHDVQPIMTGRLVRDFLVPDAAERPSAQGANFIDQQGLVLAYGALAANLTRVQSGRERLGE